MQAYQPTFVKMANILLDQSFAAPYDQEMAKIPTLCAQRAVLGIRKPSPHTGWYKTEKQDSDTHFLLE